MNIATDPVHASPVLNRLRAATGQLHRRIEAQLDLVELLADPGRRLDTIQRFAALHIPAAATLDRWAAEVPGLGACLRTAMLCPFAGVHPMPRFPVPGSRSEALGMLYVLEGSTLGGRFILWTLAARGVRDPRLAFLDPYGAENGLRWRSFLGVLAREIADVTLIAEACRGAVLAFQHAGCVLGERAA